MAKKKSAPVFKDANYRQNAFVAVSQVDQIQVGTFEYAIQHLIDNKLDLSLFNSRYILMHRLYYLQLIILPYQFPVVVLVPSFLFLGLTVLIYQLQFIVIYLLACPMCFHL